MKSKFCVGCEQTKPMADFHNLTRSADGKQSRCKACVKQYSIAYRKENKDRRAAYDKEYYKENKDRIAAYRKDNKDRIYANHLNWIKNNRDKWNEYSRNSYHTNPEHKLRAIKYSKRSGAKARELLMDIYIRKLLGFALTVDVPDELLEAKRAAIRLIRTVVQANKLLKGKS